MSIKSNLYISDHDLIDGCIALNAKMQKELYNRFASKMYAVCLRYSDNTDDAQDLLQEGFIKIYKNLSRFRAEGSFEGWVRRVFVNTAIEHYRRKLNLSIIGEREDATLTDGSITALQRLDEKDIIKLIQKLSPGYRTVFNLYVLEGFSHKEIGNILGISEGTSKSQLARAKGILQTKVNLFLDEKRKALSR
ncbi:MAG: sigma-70 family RNA polymerase sigma factor [Chitinophagaceae bacterium]